MSKVTFEEELNKTGRLVCPNLGTSMLPLIRQKRDLMVIVPKPKRRIRPFEAVFYRRGNTYLLHRVFLRRKDDYLIGADNRFFTETGITDEDIIGVLHSVIRDGKKEFKTHSFLNILYVFVWYLIFPIRFIPMYIKHIKKVKFK